MRKRITNRAVDAVRPGDRPQFLWDTDVTGFGLKVMPSGRKTYVFQYRLGGRGARSRTSPKRMTLGKHGELTPDQARKRAAKLLLAVRADEDPQQAREPEELPTVAELMQRFLAEYLPNKKRPPKSSTIRSYESLIRVHVVPALGGKRVDAVTRNDVEELHTKLRATPYVANRLLVVLHHAFKVAEAWGWLSERGNPVLHIERFPEERRGAKKEVMLSAKQMANLFAAIDEEEATNGKVVACAAIRVAFWTGWRIGEVLAVQWEHLDLESGSAKLVDTKTAREEYRQVPAEAIEVLVGVPRVAGCPYVFPGKNLRDHLTTVRESWYRIRKAAGLDDLEGLGPLRLHDLRHNVVSWDVSRGVPLEIAGKNVGHRSRQATEIYAHFAPDALKRAADERAAAMRQAVEESGTRTAEGP